MMTSLGSVGGCLIIRGFITKGIINQLEWCVLGYIVLISSVSRLKSPEIWFVSDHINHLEILW